MNDPATYVTMALAILGIAGWLIQFGWKNGSTDTKLATILALLTKYPLEKISTEVDTMWEIYVVDVLHTRPDLASRHSPLDLTDKGESLIPQNLKELLTAHAPELPSRSCTYEVIHCLGMESITDFSQKSELPVSLGLALLSLFYQKVHPDVKITEPLGVCTKPKS